MADKRIIHSITYAYLQAFDMWCMVLYIFFFHDLKTPYFVRIDFIWSIYLIRFATLTYDASTTRVLKLDHEGKYNIY